MITSFRAAGALLLSGAGLAACAPAGEQGTDAAALAAITADGLMAHTRVLASDAFEGRGPGTAGEDSTVRYLSDTFKAMGLAPGNPNGSYEQAVEMVGFTVHPTVSIRVGGKTMRLAAPADISVGSLRAVEKVVVPSSDIVFVGYGVVAPEYGWDDFKGVAYTPQEQALFQDLSVEDNLRLAMRDDKYVREGVKRIGAFFPFIPERLRQRAGTLSGGEQKMLLVARALMSRPKLMLIDEISEGLQPSVIERVTGVLRRERDSTQVSMLLIEQNVKFALSVADRYAVLKLGEIVDRGSVGDRGAEKSIADHLAV